VIARLSHWWTERERRAQARVTQQVWQDVADEMVAAGAQVDAAVRRMWRRDALAGLERDPQAVIYDELLTEAVA